jgi:carbon storage regulator CsrA
MLVLSRKNQESVVVAAASGCEQLVKVTVLNVSGGSVKLGFEASAEIPVHRAEVWERLLLEQKAAQLRLAEASSPNLRREAR